MKIDYDTQLVATRATGYAEPNKVERKKRLPFRYVIDMVIEADDHGVDWVMLDGVAIEDLEVSVDGIDWNVRNQIDIEDQSSLVELDQTLKSSARLVLSGNVRIFSDVVVRAGLANRKQFERDGYKNWQNIQQSDSGSWTVETEGAPGHLLGIVQQSASRFSPFDDESIIFSFDVDNLTNSVEIKFELFTLAGNRVQRLTKEGSAGSYHFIWDGRDYNGRVVEPGLYVYELIISGSGSSGRRRGTCVVAY